MNSMFFELESSGVSVFTDNFNIFSEQNNLTKTTILINTTTII